MKTLEALKSQTALPLDSTTSLFNYLNTSVRLNSELKFLIYSPLSNSLLQYDLRHGTLEKSLKFDSQGPNSLQGLDYGSGMHFVNSDTILFFSSSLQKLYLANLQGEVYSNYTLRNDSIGFGSVDSRSVLSYNKGSVYIQSLPIIVGRDKSEWSHRKLTISEYKLNSYELIQHPLAFANLYLEHDFSQRLEVIDFVYASKLNKFIVSLPLEESIYITDFNNSTEKIKTKSNFVQKVNKINLNFKEVLENSLSSYFFWTSDSFGKLLYDSEKNYIYRVARLAISHEQFMAKDFYAKQEVLVINNSKELIGSIPHSGTSFVYHFFNEKGVSWNSSFKDFNISKNNEDTLYFENYEIYK